MQANSTLFIRHSTTIRWYAPMSITKVLSDYLFELQDLQSKEISVAHGTKIRLFRNKDWSMTDEVNEHLSYQKCDFCFSDEFIDVRSYHGNREVQVLS